MKNVTLNEFDKTFKLSIHKTLEKNLPLQIDNTKDEIHFTEDGKIYISKNDGTFRSCNTGDIIREVSNPLTTQPLEYGSFKMSVDQKEPFIANVTPIKFDISIGNISTNDNKVILKKGKTYNITYALNAQVTGTLGFYSILYDVTNSKELCITSNVPVTSNSGVTTIPTGQIILTPETDTEIEIRTNADYISTVYANSSYLNIYEVKNNPVNQYGGFESQILFDGNANEVDEYQLSDDINNYDLLIIKSNDTILQQSIVPNMTSNSYNGYVASASSVLLNRDMSQPYTAFDGKTPSGQSDQAGFLTNNTVDGWLKIELPSEKEVKSFSICSFVMITSGLKDFYIEGSNDDIKWDILGEYTTGPWSNGVYKDFKLSKTGLYKYYRVSFTSNHGYTYSSIGELKLYENDKSKNIQTKIITVSDLEDIISFYNGELYFSNNKFFITSNTKISKIIGIKGQLPSLLSGGEF